MNNDKLREIPLKNYIILGVVIFVSILLLYYFYMWVMAYEDNRLSSPILDEYMEVINYNELDDYLVENPNAIIYVSVLKNNDIRTFERKLKSVIKNNQLSRDILYMNITDELNDSDMKLMLKKKYSLNSLSIIDVPVVMVFDNGELKYIHGVKDHGYDINKFKLFINGIKFSNEEM